MTSFLLMKIDLKSALFGLSLGVVATVAVGAASSSGPVGRYQISGTSEHGLVIDTATGQVWRAFLPTGSGSADGDFFTAKIEQKK